jgi:hypothetical protein
MAADRDLPAGVIQLAVPARNRVYTVRIHG